MGERPERADYSRALLPLLLLLLLLLPHSPPPLSGCCCSYQSCSHLGFWAQMVASITTLSSSHATAAVARDAPADEILANAADVDGATGNR